MQNSNYSEHYDDASWPRRLNVALITIGVLAFGLLIIDRFTELFNAKHLPEIVIEKRSFATPTAEKVAVAEKTEDEEIAIAKANNESLNGSDLSVLDLDEVFGSRLVFVSAADPMYVVTENDKRFDVGSSVSDGLTFAGATQQQVILDNDGDLIVISLPTPTVQ